MRHLKKRLLITITLLAALLLLCSTAAAAEGDSGITWSPEPVIAGGDTLRTYEFYPPESMEFKTHYDIPPVYDTDGTMISDWIPEGGTEFFTWTREQLRAMPEEAKVSYKWEYRYESEVATTGFPGTFNEDPGKCYFIQPGTYTIYLTVTYRSYYMPHGHAPGYEEWRDARCELTLENLTVLPGQPMLFGIWQQTYGQEKVLHTMNEFVIQAGALSVPAVRDYTWGNVHWTREEGAFVCAYNTIAGEGVYDDPDIRDALTVVTVYAEDGDTKVTLGTKEFPASSLNYINGTEVVSHIDYILNTVPFAPASLASVKPGVYKLMADTAPNIVNDASTSEIGSLTVEGITSVTPDPVTAQKGVADTKQLTAQVETIGDNVDTTVKWSLSGSKTQGTKVDETTGLLTIAPDETADSFTVTATSVSDNGGQGQVSGSATVTLQSITGVTVSPADASVEIGETLPFTAAVTAVNGAPETVHWTVTGGLDSEIDQDGLLSVGPDEKEGTTLHVTAVSDYDNSKQDTVTVTVVDANENRFMPENPERGKIDPSKDLVIKFPGNPKDVTGAFMNKTAFTLKGIGTDTIEGYTADGIHAFTGASGSVIVTLYREYLNTLPDGDYTFTLEFAEGSGTAAFTIKREKSPLTPGETASSSGTGGKTSSPGTGSKASSPKAGGKASSPGTGDEAEVWLWTLLAAASLLGIIIYCKKRDVKSLN